MKPRTRSLLAGGGIMAAIAALIIVNGIWSLKNCGRLRGPPMGQPAPQFALKTTDGKTMRLGDLRGKVVLVDFWASWCRPCLRKMPLLERMQVELGQRGLKVLGVNIEGDPRLVQRFVERRKPKVTMLVDNGQVAGRYGVQRLPHVVVVDRSGQLIFVQSGNRGHARLRERVLAALAR